MTPFVHPRSHQAIGRAMWSLENARLHVASARAHRLAGRPDWALSSLRHAAHARGQAKIHFSDSRFMERYLAQRAAQEAV